MLGFLLDQVKNAIGLHSQQNSYDAGSLLNQVEQLFTQHAANTGQTILPASQDPYGDPANGGGRILPVSQDPYGDPADRAAGILPASQDPYGDPADRR